MGNDKLAEEYISYLDTEPTILIWVPKHSGHTWHSDQEIFADSTHIYVTIQEEAISSMHDRMYHTTQHKRFKRIKGLYKYENNIHYFALEDTPELRERLNIGVIKSVLVAKNRWELI